MSLIESTVSAAIIVTAVVIAVPSLLQTRDDYVLRSTAHDVASKMQAARIRAISRNIECRLHVTSGATYAVECQDPIWAVTDSIVLPPGMTISATTSPKFHRLGNVVPAATITVSNPAGRQLKVIINNGGRIRID